MLVAPTVVFAGLGFLGDGEGVVYADRFDMLGRFPDGSPASHPYSFWDVMKAQDYKLGGGAGGGGTGGAGQILREGEIGSISPSSGPTSGGTSVTITGRRFFGVTSILFGNTPAAFTVISPTRIIATSPPRAAGPVDIRVVTVAGTSPISPAGRFTYTVAGTAASVAGPASLSDAARQLMNSEPDIPPLLATDNDDATGGNPAGVPSQNEEPPAAKTLDELGQPLSMPEGAYRQALDALFGDSSAAEPEAGLAEPWTSPRLWEVSTTQRLGWIETLQ